MKDVLVQPGGGGADPPLAHGVLQQLDLLGQRLDLGLVRLGLGVLIDQGHRLPHAHLLPLAAGELHDARLGGEDALLPDQQSVGLHAVVGGIGVDQGGAVGLVQGLEDVKPEVDAQHRQDGEHDKGDQRFSLFHREFLFCFSRS